MGKISFSFKDVSTVLTTNLFAAHSEKQFRIQRRVSTVLTTNLFAAKTGNNNLGGL